ncbi:MAG: phage tail tube protein [Candidatus Thorarchaeota archaeon]
MAIISGQDAALQIGLETTWGTAVTPTLQFDFTSESLNYMVDRVAEDALVGRKTTGRMDLMKVHTEGDFSGIVKPDNIGLLLGATTGEEAAAVVAPAQAEVTRVIAVADVAGNLDGTYFTLDDPTTSYYVWIEVDTSTNDPAPGGTAINVDITSGATASAVASAIQTAVDGEGDFSATVSDNVVTITNASTGAADDAADVDTGFTISTLTQGRAIATSAYNHAFTPVAGGTSGSLPHLTVTVDRKVAEFDYVSSKINQLQLQADVGDYLRATFGIVGYTEAAGSIQSLSASTLKPFRFRDGAVTVDGVAYDDVTSFSLTYANNLESDTWTMGSGIYLNEIEPQARDITLSLDVLYSATTNATRDAKYKADSTVALVLTFTSEEEAETDHPYELTISVPVGYITQASPNISGPERIKQTLEVTATEGASEAITITLTDAQSTDYL